MSAVVNFTDGSLNAGLALSFQVTDVGMLIFLRPFNSLKTELTEDIGSFTNLATFIVITFPVISELELPVWIGDLSRISLAVIATSVAAFASILEPLKKLCNVGIALGAKLSCCGSIDMSWLPCLHNTDTPGFQGGTAFDVAARAAVIALSNTQVF